MHSFGIVRILVHQANFYIISTLGINPSLRSWWILCECFCFGNEAMNGSAKSHQQHLTQATFIPGGTHIRKGWVYSSSCLGLFGLTQSVQDDNNKKPFRLVSIFGFNFYLFLESGVPPVQVPLLNSS